MRRTLTALALAVTLAACGGGGPVQERDGEGAIFSDPTADTWGANQDAKNGSTWSAGSVLLCKTGEAVPTIASVTPLKVSGEVTLDDVGVRTARRPPSIEAAHDTDTYLVGTMHGKPTNLEEPDGYVVPTNCENPEEPLGEIVVTMTKTGPTGGALDGLRVTYVVDGETHVFDLGFHFGLRSAA